MKVINIFVGFHSDLEHNWTWKSYSFLEQSSCGSLLQCQTIVASGGWNCQKHSCWLHIYVLVSPSEPEH